MLYVCQESLILYEAIRIDFIALILDSFCGWLCNNFDSTLTIYVVCCVERDIYVSKTGAVSGLGIEIVIDNIIIFGSICNVLMLNIDCERLIEPVSRFLSFRF